MDDARSTSKGGSDTLTVQAAHRALALEDLAYLNRMTTVGQVLPNVAHELNNALQIISGTVEVLAMRQGLPADATEKLSRIGAQAARATDMLRQLVTFARRDDAGVAIVDVVKLAERSVAFRRFHLGRAGITVTVGGCGHGQALARADGNHVQQVLLNLIINAEHSLEGIRDGRVEVTIERRDGAIEVRVADNGAGMPADLAARVTDPFFTTKATAAGLGLTVAGALARAQGGSLRLEPGESGRGGTVAILLLPAAA